MDYDAFFNLVSRRKSSTSTGNLNFSGVLNTNTSLSVLLGFHVTSSYCKIKTCQALLVHYLQA